MEPNENKKSLYVMCFEMLLFDPKMIVGEQRVPFGFVSTYLIPSLSWSSFVAHSCLCGL